MSERWLFLKISNGTITGLMTAKMSMSKCDTGLILERMSVSSYRTWNSSSPMTLYYSISHEIAHFRNLLLLLLKVLQALKFQDIRFFVTYVWNCMQYNNKCCFLFPSYILTTNKHMQLYFMYIYIFIQYTIITNMLKNWY